MKEISKIFVYWGITAVFYFIGFQFFPHRNVFGTGFITSIILLLLFYISFYIYKSEPNKKNKLVFFNYILFFGLPFISYVYNFVGTSFFTGYKYSSHIFFQYNCILYSFVLAVALVYLVIDVLFNNFKTYQKYFWAISLVVVVFAYYFLPFFTDPLYLYSSEDIKQWKTLDEYVRAHGNGLSLEEVAKNVNLQTWRDGKPVGNLYPADNLNRIDELSPYLEGNNYLILLMKPLYVNVIHLDIFLIGIILLFFGYQYKKDPPQGAYIDKIMFTFLLFISTEIIHSWGFIKSLEWRSFVDLANISQYVTMFLLVPMVVFFLLRLRFITSIHGEFYETELATNPQKVTRWRDWMDNLILARFFNPRSVHGRLFQQINNK